MRQPVGPVLGLFSKWRPTQKTSDHRDRGGRVERRRAAILAIAFSPPSQLVKGQGSASRSPMTSLSNSMAAGSTSRLSLAYLPSSSLPYHAKTATPSMASRDDRLLSQAALEGCLYIRPLSGDDQTSGERVKKDGMDHVGHRPNDRLRPCSRQNLTPAPPSARECQGCGRCLRLHGLEERPMQSTSTLGLGTSKSVFQVRGVDAPGRVVLRRQLRRRHVFQKLSPCLVGIAACASSHHWSHELQALGHTMRLMPSA